MPKADAPRRIFNQVSPLLATGYWLLVTGFWYLVDNSTISNLGNSLKVIL